MLVKVKIKKPLHIDFQEIRVFIRDLDRKKT